MKYNIILSIFLICFLIDKSYSQYTNDTCTRYTASEGVITVDGSIEQYCWKIIPNIGIGYYPTEIYITLQQATGLTDENNTLFIIAGELMTDKELASYHEDVVTPQETVSSKAGQVLIYVEYMAPVNYTITYSVSSDKSLKDSILMLVSVIFAFAIPTTCVACCSCCKGEKKVKKNRQNYGFFFGTALGLVILAVILSRKVIH